MKRCFLVTSAIQPSSEVPFKATVNRSVFSTAERLQHTVAGLLNLNSADPEAEIILVDSSEQRFSEIDLLPKVQYHRLIDIHPEICKVVNSHTSKSYCESLILKTFLHTTDMQYFDFITKVSGRYLIDHSFNTQHFTKENQNRMLFKRMLVHPVAFLRPNFLKVLPQELVVDGELRGFYTFIYSVGRECMDIWHQLLDQTLRDSEKESSKFYWSDVEYAFYYYLHQANLLDRVQEVDWNVYGWGGTNGVFQRA